MEKISIRPKTKEILIRSEAPDGHSDLFSYNYWGESDAVPPRENSEELGKKLGSLFVVGQVKPATEETSYMISLVASLAKREYYSKPELGPKEAFSAALKKINEALEDFFRNEEVKINIGLFIIAGENIFISRIGKFKIVLARDGQDIDILNNITLFSKDHIQEKEFSNIISGKIFAGDKILAFYPSKSLSSREQYIRSNLAKSDPEQFVERLNLIKTERENFECAAIYASIEKFKEAAVFKRPQPQEMKEKMRAAQAALTAEPMKKPTAPTIEDKPTNTPAQPKKDPAPLEPPIDVPPPSMMPSEVSLGKKPNALMSFIGKFNFKKTKGLGSIKSLSRSNGKLKYIVIIAVVVLIGGFAAFKMFWGLSPEKKALKNYEKQAQTAVETAKEQINLGNFFEARKTILESLNGTALSAENKSTSELIDLLDKLDGAVPAGARMTDALPEEIGRRNVVLRAEEEKLKTGQYQLPSPAIDSDLYEDNLYILSADSIYKVLDASKGTNAPTKWLSTGASLFDPALIAVDRNVYVLNKLGQLTVYYKGEKTKEFNSDLFVSPENDILLTTKDSPNLYVVNKKLARIYVITKDSGSLSAVFRTESVGSVLAAYADKDGTIYLFNNQDQVWEVK
ncbi:MAG: hypothetical protein A3B99_00655 [Candidatus Yanofskybacteria bacterium RIFCSPHIGHO2_02_FULL_44_12b]|uniref:PPM-type phosphatase domain-containing protein n=2 Tax=Candidatus Yanofskyibacteriota TaxID=1752733 RepID=A0A1F8GKG7_9BACT|nr:MAG: hypothetical protein UW79_C0016G0006 [Candidatus Yanofskybacteria bacterium GW2011_GWA2_44_9]OGN05122.1 MAG: hypothetical protein A2659_02175 [Candidatus Yanofskybacteria bacterium RIFCSPHIGHO2_01_FULL_44_24]OGN15989.1 MAG: hypothetical protein A3B99_00655 [Candidatus Yanofskybacteria bacterium RIFCSPHIGHO2_02_FULL_44_12b]OGN25500.1 MAG: hypothetical protein A2925_02100 [Candidatus Yanofskybacteria bacterium RIFCSPLOWO2_01_FULL_44_22]